MRKGRTKRLVRTIAAAARSHSRRPTYTATSRIGAAFNDAAAAIQSGPLGRSTPYTSAARSSGWTFPLAAAGRSNPAEIHVIHAPATVRVRKAGHRQRALAPKRTAIHPAYTACCGSMVSGTQTAANHGA